MSCWNSSNFHIFLFRPRAVRSSNMYLSVADITDWFTSDWGTSPRSVAGAAKARANVTISALGRGAVRCARRDDICTRGPNELNTDPFSYHTSTDGPMFWTATSRWQITAFGAYLVPAWSKQCDVPYPQSMLQLMLCERYLRAIGWEARTLSQVLASRSSCRKTYISKSFKRR